MKSAEEKIWDYIDGNCTAAETQEIELLLVNNAAFKKLYEDILAFNNSLQLSDLDEPSMGFTNKVMQTIHVQTSPLSAEVRVDKRVVYAIAGVFIVAIVLIFTIALANIDWSAKPAYLTFMSESYEAFSMGEGFKSTLINGFIFFDILAGLLILDHFLRKRKLA